MSLQKQLLRLGIEVKPDKIIFHKPISLGDRVEGDLITDADLSDFVTSADASKLVKKEVTKATSTSD